jgi:hypothetical protein
MTLKAYAASALRPARGTWHTEVRINSAPQRRQA